MSSWLRVAARMRLGPGRQSGIPGTIMVMCLMLTLAACGRRSEPDYVPRYTHPQAVTLVNQYIHDFVHRLDPQPRLELLRGGDIECAGPNDDQDTGLVMYERTFWLRSLNKADNNTVLKKLKEYWSANGFTITLGATNAPAHLWHVAARNQFTEFKMDMVEGSSGSLSMGAQSPCVRPVDSSASPTAELSPTID
jgi:hypothetical protein